MVLIPPLLPEDTSEEVVVGSHWDTIIGIIRTHDAPGICINNGTLECREITISITNNSV